MVDNSICIASDLKTIKLLQTPDDTGSIMYMSEKLKSEIQRLRIEKAKLEQSAKLKAGLRKDIETKVPALKLNKYVYFCSKMSVIIILIFEEQLFLLKLISNSNKRAQRAIKLVRIPIVNNFLCR